MHLAPANESEKDEDLAPHTLITSDLGELRAELGTGEPA
jgi:hypothetical protein